MLVGGGLAGFVIYDMQAGLPLRSMALLLLSDGIEVSIAALGVRYALGGPPRLSTVRALSQYVFFAVILAPAIAAFVGALAFGGIYWTTWRLSYFTEALALLTLTPAILSWRHTLSTREKRSRGYYAEGIALIAGLVLWGYFLFEAIGHEVSSALLYSLLPFLLWSALRFGLTGITTSMVLVAFLSIWGAVHGRGPFAGTDPFRNVQALQLFLFSAATPLLYLAALVEEQRETAQAVRESEGRFRLVANAAPVLIWMSDTSKLCNYFNLRWLEFTGRSLKEELGNGWSEGVHPEDLAMCIDVYVRSFDAHKPFKMQYRLRRHDGEYRWIVDIGVPRFNEDGSFAGYIGSCIDVTDRKTAEEAMSTVGRKLIEAAENERVRIARELHDDICQRLTILGLEIEQSIKSSGGIGPHVEKMREAREQCSGITGDVQALSHELHSSMLDHLGLIAAAHSFCHEFSEQQSVTVRFSHEGVPNSLPREVSLCLFRVTQEALHNAVKHSGASIFDVSLLGTANTLELDVHDGGIGFDLDRVKQNGGLGLVSMEERVHLVKGTFSIDSKANEGTTVRARVPLC
jgi:PAS domain S-box-containing protein